LFRVFGISIVQLFADQFLMAVCASVFSLQCFMSPLSSFQLFSSSMGLNVLRPLFVEHFTF